MKSRLTTIAPHKRFLLLVGSLAVFTVVTAFDDGGKVQNEDYLEGYARARGAISQASLEDDRRSEIFVATARRIFDEIEREQQETVTVQKQATTYIGIFLYYLQKFLDIVFLANVPTQEQPVTSNGYVQGSPHSRIWQAESQLKAAANLDNADAVYLLAEMNMYGNWTYPRNYRDAFHYYKDLAGMTGNRSAQNMVGFFYATGYQGAVERDQAKALMYHTFAALSGDTRSEMTVAFRHHAGIGTQRSCDDAALFYKRVADKAMDWYLSGPPGGMHVVRHSNKLADDHGGVYGEGASHTSAGGNNRRKYGDQASSMEDIVEYLDLMTRKGDIGATLQLAKLFYEGPKGTSRDLERAKMYFSRIAKAYWVGPGDKIIAKPSALLRECAIKSAGFLGRMYLRGESVPQDFSKAQMWFKRGLTHWGLGYMYEFGLGGVSQNTEMSTKLYNQAANADHGPSQVAIGKAFHAQGEIGAANKWFELASRHGLVDAYYWLAEINNNNQGKERSCSVATVYYKVVAERIEPLQSSLEWAHKKYEKGERESALTGFMMAAEQGYESGQANVAYLLDEENSKLNLEFWKKKRNSTREQELALIYWTRSAKQSNIDSYVKMGDYYLEGIGAELDPTKAASCYQAAAEHQFSAQALWNLGWMHENGIGVEQDYHLAKRYYDQALESNTEAYLPVSLSLLKLRVRSFWNDITNGGINAMGNDPEPQKDWSFREWLRKWFFPNSDPNTASNRRANNAAGGGADGGAANGGEETAMPDMAGNDFYDGDFDDDAIENLIILFVFMGVAVLFFIRNQRQNNARNNNQQPPVVQGVVPGQQPPLQQQQQQQQQADFQNQFFMMPPPLGG